MTILWWNVAGGLNAKFNFVRQIVDDYKPHLLFISESNIKIDKNNKHLGISGYNLVVSDSNFSRTACYVKKSSDFVTVTKGKGSEIIALENKNSE